MKRKRTIDESTLLYGPALMAVFSVVMPLLLVLYVPCLFFLALFLMVYTRSVKDDERRKNSFKLLFGATVGLGFAVGLCCLIESMARR